MQFSAHGYGGPDTVPTKGRMYQGIILTATPKQRVGSARVPRWFRLAALLLIGSCPFIGVYLYLDPPPQPQSQEVRSESVSDPGIPDLPAPITIILGKSSTLSGVLAAHGIPPNTVTQIVQALGLHLNLHKLQPEDTLQLHRNPDGAVTKVVYRQSPNDTFEVHREEHGWVVYIG